MEVLTRPFREGGLPIPYDALLEAVLRMHVEHSRELGRTILELQQHVRILSEVLKVTESTRPTAKPTIAKAYGIHTPVLYPDTTAY